VKGKYSYGVNWRCLLGCRTFHYNGPIWCVNKQLSYWSLPDEDRDPRCIYVYMCSANNTKIYITSHTNWFIMIQAVIFKTWQQHLLYVCLMN